ncbi:MAG TPA: hypothetical protein VN788_10820 [Verrucomicrobiae bacterium]|nr:hypothetical protein [Verrucomicrobiae bacterium]
MPSSERKALLAAVASTIADYRLGEIPPLDENHVATWIGQFEQPVQEPMLAELDHVLKKTYISKPKVEAFLTSVLQSRQLVGASPCDFWRSANFLDIQGGGSSQREMREMFSQQLKHVCGLRIDQCGLAYGPYVYLDDVIFTGNRVRSDLRNWINSSAPANVKVHVIVIAFHRGGNYYAKTGIAAASTAAGKTIDVTFWRHLEIEDRKARNAYADVLRPASIPTDDLTQAYVQSLTHPPLVRTGTLLGENNFFFSDSGRNLLEQELLKAGLRIRSQCPYLNIYQRPLGNMVLASLGFGATIVTFRNCPNNCPLAFWAGDPWYPLFPRKTN